MQNVHPIFQQALAGIAPPPGAKHWQAMNADLRRHLAQYDAPPCPRGCFSYTYQHPELGDLECHIEAEEGDESVGWPAQVTLCSAYLRGVDITARLTDDEVEAIELAAVKAPREQLEEV
jgi:hypothetical protein